MEVVLTYLIGNAVALQRGFFYMGLFLISLMFVNQFTLDRKGFFIWVSLIFFCFILSFLIPDSHTCVAMLNAMKS